MIREPIPMTCPNNIKHRSMRAMSRYYGIPPSTVWSRLRRQKLPLWAALGLPKPSYYKTPLSRAQRLRIERVQAMKRKPCAYTRLLMERSR